MSLFGSYPVTSIVESFSLIDSPPRGSRKFCISMPTAEVRLVNAAEPTHLRAGFIFQSACRAKWRSRHFALEWTEGAGRCPAASRAGVTKIPLPVKNPARSGPNPALPLS